MPSTSAAPQALYQHEAHPHTPTDVLAKHKAARRAGSGMIRRANDWLAVRSSGVLGSMWTFYLFILLAFTGFPGIPWVMCTPQAFVAWLSSQTIQLVALPLLGAGQIVLNRHAELQSNENYNNIVRLLHEQDQHRRHLDAQDVVLRAIDARLPARGQSTPTEPPTPLPPQQRDAKGRFLKRALS